MFKPSLMAALMLPVAANAQLTQEQVNRFAANTELMYSVQSNFHNEDKSFLGEITLSNRSNIDLPKGKQDW